MKARAEIIITLQQFLKDKRMTQADAAELFGVTQPRISDLMRGKIDLFSIDMLVNMLSATGKDFEIHIKHQRQVRTA
jgi:predicted XRE-type DNA-binding protein